MDHASKKEITIQLFVHEVPLAQNHPRRNVALKRYQGSLWQLWMNSTQIEMCIRKLKSLRFSFKKIHISIDFTKS